MRRRDSARRAATSAEMRWSGEDRVVASWYRTWRARVAARALALGAAALACGALAVGAAAGSAPVAMAHAAETPVQQAVTLDSPAVVRIVSAVEARLTCAHCATDGSDIVSPASGSPAFAYFSSGSGAFITSSGAILTADHVVDHSMANPEDVDFVEQQAAQDIAQRYNSTSATVLSYLQNNPNSVSINFATTLQRAFLSTAYTGELTSTSRLYAFDISAIAASSPVTKQDTAILRLNTSGVSPAPDFPFLTLSDGNVQTLDNVTAIAYPADADLALNSSADFTSLLDPSTSDASTLSSLLTASVNPGQVTKVDTQGYEATGIASNGSSGGPVINDQGQVIGFVDRGSSTDRVTVIIPSSVVSTYAAQVGIPQAPQGRFMSLWSRAVTDYYATGTCHWTNAASDFSTLNKQYPQFGGASQLADEARLKAAGESCATGGATTTGGAGSVTSGLAILIGCVVALLAMIAGVIFLIVAVTRRKPNSARVAAPAGPPLYPLAAPPAAPPAGYQPSNGPVYPTQPAPPYPPVAPPTSYAPGPYAPPVPAAQRSGPSAPREMTRFCPRGHAVLEPDGTFCPTCGAPMPPVPAR